MKDLDTSDPMKHVENIKNELQKLINHLRKDIHRVNDPKAMALFETSAEVLTGLKTAFSHFEEKQEEAWKK